MICALNEDLAAISRLSAENELLFNPRKSQASRFRILLCVVLPCLFLGTENITWSDAVTDLGVVTDGLLRFNREVAKVCSRVYASLHRLRLLKFVTPKRIRLKLCKALLLPYFFYRDVVFSYLSSVESRRLQVSFNSCTYPHAGMNS
jgi:hypothetical protein